MQQTHVLGQKYSLLSTSEAAEQEQGVECHEPVLDVSRIHYKVMYWKHPEFIKNLYTGCIKNSL